MSGFFGKVLTSQQPSGSGWPSSQRVPPLEERADVRSVISVDSGDEVKSSAVANCVVRYGEDSECDDSHLLRLCKPHVVLNSHPSRAVLNRLVESGSMAVVSSNAKSSRTKKNRPTPLPKMKDKVWNIFAQQFPFAPVSRHADDFQYKVCQDVDNYASFNTSSTANTYAGVYFVVGGLPQWSQLSAVFDQYRIEAIEVWCNVEVGINNLNPRNTTFATCIDYDDAVPPTSIASILEHQNALMTDEGNGHYRCFIPHVALATYNGSGFTQYTNEVAPWLDTSSNGSGAVHYGIKLGVTTNQGSETCIVRARFWLAFKNVQ